MTFLRSKFSKWVVWGGVATLLALGIGFRHSIASYVVTCYLESQTGFQTHIRGLHLHLFKLQVDIAEIEILNPPAYQHRRAMLIQNMECHYSLLKLLKGQLHIVRLKLNLVEIYRIRAVSGAENLDALEGFVKHRLDSGKLKIDSLILSIREAQYINEKKPKREPIVCQCQIEDQTFKNIITSKEFSKVIQVIIQKTVSKNIGSILKTTLKNVFDDIRELFD